MSGTWLPHKEVWTQQPQVPVRIAWDNPLTKGLLNCYYGGTNFRYDAASGKVVSTYAKTGTIAIATVNGEKCLHTPNGGIAEVPISEDWSGPCTVFFECYISSVDSPWGGLFAKNSDVQSQIQVGRNATNDYYYLARGASVDPLTSAVISTSLSRKITFAITNAGTATNAERKFYIDGVLVQTSVNAVGAQQTGNGTLYLGSEKSASAAYDSDVKWVSFYRYNRVLTNQEIAALHRAPNSIFQPETRRIWVSSTAGGATTLTGDISTEHNESTTGSISQTHILTGASGQMDNASSTGGIGQTNILSGDNAAMTNEASTGAISTGVALTGDAAQINLESTTGVISQTRVLTGDSASIDSASSVGGISQTHILTGDGAQQDYQSSTGAIGTGTPINLSGDNSEIALESTSGAVSISDIPSSVGGGGGSGWILFSEQKKEKKKKKAEEKVETVRESLNKILEPEEKPVIETVSDRVLEQPVETLDISALKKVVTKIKQDTKQLVAQEQATRAEAEKLKQRKIRAAILLLTEMDYD